VARRRAATKTADAEPWSAEDSLIASALRDAAEAGNLSWRTVTPQGQDPHRIYRLHEPVDGDGPDDPPGYRVLTADERRVLDRLIDEAHLAVTRGLSTSDRGAVTVLQS